MEQEHFLDEKFMSSAEKQQVLKAWKRFLKNGCRFHDFTKALYRHLTLHCSFIAHFDRGGFYAVYFSQPSDFTQRFFDQFDPAKSGLSAEYRSTSWLGKYATASDLNQAMRQHAGPYLSKLREHYAEIERQRDLVIASNLLAKHGKRIADGPGIDSPPLSPQVIPMVSHQATQYSLHYPLAGETCSQITPREVS